MDRPTNGFGVIKVFISSVKEYNKQRTEAVSQKLQRNLQILSTIADINVFDPNRTDGAEFYVSLYDLMSTLDSRTGLMWCAVSVLEEASRNPAAQYALIHKYKFTPILTELLSGHLIYDKQIRVLRLIQEFTYGVKIFWQDAHLPLLISILIKWIKDNDKCSELVSLSLGVLANLCYKNLPAIYALRRVIDIKDFIKSILLQVKDNLDIRVQGYKMLIIFEEVSGEISDQEILSYVTWTFKRMYEALETGNVSAMRHIVDFFKDIVQNSNFKNVLLKYQRYSADTERLLVLLEQKKESIEESECATLLLEFVQSVILLETSDLERLYESLIKITLNLTETNSHVSHMALQLICTVIAESRKSIRNNHCSIIKQLDTALPMLLNSLNVKDASGQTSKNSVTALFSFLLEMSQEPSSSKRILSSLQPAVIKSYFLNILSPDSSENENLLDESSSSFYLQGLSLVSSLSAMEEDWNSLFNELMQHKKLKMRLAVSLYSGSPQIKCQVLKLIAHLGQDNRLLMDLSHCMSELDKLVAPVINMSDLNGFNLQRDRSSDSNQHCSTPLLSLAQQSRLDQCIATLQQAISNNQLGSIGTAAVLELYEYRVAAMSHTESVLQGNLQAADKYCTQLRHRVSIMTSEMNKLLSMLHNKEESLEMSQQAVASLQRGLLAAESSLRSSQSLYAQAVQDLKIKSKILDELSQELNNIKIMLKEKQEENILLTDQLRVKCKEFEEAKAELKCRTEELEDKTEIIKQQSENLREMNLVVQNREKKIEQHEELIKHLEKSVCDKDNEIAQYQAEIAELEAMRNIIMKVTMDKEKKQGKKQ